MRTLNGHLDHGVSGVLEYLRQTRRDDLLFVMTGDFGRTPRTNGSGRDHYRRGNFVVLAGAGVEGGACVGTTNRRTGVPRSVHSREDVLRTIYAAAGVTREPGTAIVNGVLRGK